MAIAVRPRQGGFPITGHLPRQGSDEHMTLVKKAIDYLRVNGFKDEEIYTAFVIQTKFRPQPRIVDVVGLRSGHRIAIECGKTSRGYLDMIRPYFDEVLHYPFPNRKPYY